MEKFTDIESYIQAQSQEAQDRLRSIDALVREIAPEAKGVISYGMPTYKLNGPLIHFAAFKAHIGLYPTPSGVEFFEQKSTGYKTSKGGIQLPMDKPLPLDLIREIIEYRVEKTKR